MRLRPLVTAAALCLALPFATHAQQPAPDHHDKPPVQPSHAVVVTFQGHSITMKAEDLLNLPQVTLHVHNAHSNQDETYSGPLVSEVLARAGLHTNPETQPLILHSALVATATDNYFVLYSVAEVEPGFSKGQSIVAVMRNGLPVESGIEIVNDTDAKPARWIHGLTNLNIVGMGRQQ